MIGDRYYMRGGEDYSPSSSSWSCSTWLMIVLVVGFALQQINAVYIRWPLEVHLALSPEGLRSGCLWQLFTYLFLHGGLMHLAFNLMGLYFFGRPVENFLGRRNFLLIYFASGLIGGALQGILGLLFPQYFGHWVVGASAGVCGILVAFCLMEPEAQILLFFVLPVKARHMLYVFFGVALFFTIVPSDPGIAHAAHLGGMITGAAFLRLGLHRQEFSFMDGVREKLRRWRTPKPKLKVWSGRGQGGTAENGGADFMASKVDPILDKISKSGIQSLTAEERRILEAARKKMGK